MIQTRYITADEFRQIMGIDLEEELKGTSNPSDKVNAFLARVEDRMEAYLNAKFFKKVNDYWIYWNDYNKMLYKKALAEQAYYVFKNGDIITDSGYDPEHGIITSKHALSELVIAPAAQNLLRLCGMWNAHIGGFVW